MAIESFGPHRVRHGDLMGAGAIDELVGGDAVDIMYSDPPWGSGALKLFHTLNRKQTGQEVAPAAHSDFLARVFDTAADHAGKWLVIEYGQRWREEILDHGHRAGFALAAVTPATYAQKLSVDISIFHRADYAPPDGVVTLDYIKGIRGTTGLTLVKAALWPLMDSVRVARGSVRVLDPCCGMGFTAQATVDRGGVFLGNELNAHRLEKTKNRLRKAVAKAGNA